MASKIAALQAKLGGGAMIMGGLRPGGAPPFKKKPKEATDKGLDNSAVLDRPVVPQGNRSKNTNDQRDIDQLAPDNDYKEDAAFSQSIVNMDNSDTKSDETPSANPDNDPLDPDAESDKMTESNIETVDSSNNMSSQKVEEEWKEQDDNLRLSDDEDGSPEPLEAKLLVDGMKLTAHSSVIDLLMDTDPDSKWDEWNNQDDKLKLSRENTPELDEAQVLVDDNKLTSGASVVDLLMGTEEEVEQEEEEWREQDENLRLSDAEEDHDPLVLLSEMKLESDGSVIDMLMGSEIDPNMDPKDREILELRQENAKLKQVNALNEKMIASLKTKLAAATGGADKKSAKSAKPHPKKHKKEDPKNGAKKAHPKNNSKDHGKDHGKVSELKKWMEKHHVFEKTLYSALKGKHIKSLKDLKAMKQRDLDDVLKGVRVARLAKTKDKKAHKVVENELVHFEKEVAKAKKHKKGHGKGGHDKKAKK